MPDPHFVSDYRRLVVNFLSLYPEDEAVRRAVGDPDDVVGPIERAIVRWAGLGRDGTLVDVGCGCGQLAAALDKDFEGSYLGTDIVPELIDYARRRTSPRFQFAVVDDLTIPMGDAQADMVCLFSVLAHLHHDESFHLLREAARVLRPGGAIVATHLEFSVADHWQHFVAYAESDDPVHLNAFIEAPVFDAWAPHLGMVAEDHVRSGVPPASGQSLVVLRKL